MNDTHTNYDQLEEFLNRHGDDGLVAEVRSLRRKERELAIKNQRLENIAKFAHDALIPSGAMGEFYREELLRIRNIATIGKP